MTLQEGLSLGAAQQLPAPMRGFRDTHSFAETGGQGGHPSSVLSSWTLLAAPLSDEKNNGKTLPNDIKLCLARMSASTLRSVRQ